MKTSAGPQRVPREVHAAVQKIRHSTLTAAADQRKIEDPWLTPNQARALLRWIDKHQVDGA